MIDVPDNAPQFDIQTFVVTSAGDPSPEVTELLAQEGWSIVRTEWLREGGDLPQSEVADDGHRDEAERAACGCRTTDNERRAAELCAWARCWVADGATSDGLVPYRDRLAAALDEAEARGRAEVVAKIEALAEELGGWGDTAPSRQQVWLADRLRVLAAEVTS